VILVDTSILIGYFRGLTGSPYDKMNYLVDNDIPYCICYYVYQELLQGAANKREYDQLKEYLSSLPIYDLSHGRKSFEDAALMYMNCRKHGITIRSTIDMLIAQIAIENRLFLFHNDNDFTRISKLNKNLKIYT
jgi:predicted nucleic acid-binding protein